MSVGRAARAGARPDLIGLAAVVGLIAFLFAESIGRSGAGVPWFVIGFGVVIVLAVTIAVATRFRTGTSPGERLGLNLLAQAYLARPPHTNAWDDDTTPRDQARRIAVAALASSDDRRTRDLLFDVATADEATSSWPGSSSSEQQSSAEVRRRALVAVSHHDDLDELIYLIVLAGVRPHRRRSEGLDDASLQHLEIIRKLQLKLGDDGLRRLMKLVAGTDADFAVLVLRAIRSREDQ